MKCKRCGDEECIGVKHYKCKRCKTLNCYSERYDAYFCSRCNKWLESKCKDIKCPFCSERPSKPLKKIEMN